MATSSSSRRPRPASYHQDMSLSSSGKSSDAAKKSLATSPSKGREASSSSLALKIPPKVDRTWRRSASPGARSSASGSSTGSSDSLPSRKATATLRKLARMRDDDRLIDMALVFYGTEIRCHRIVLAATSPYFRDILAVPSHLTKFDTIALKGVDQIVIRALVEYAYTSTIRVGNDRVKTLLEAANMFQFQNVIDACVEHLKQSRRKIRQRSTSRQRSENGTSSGSSPRSASPRSTPVQSPKGDSPLSSTPSSLSLTSSKNGSPHISITDDDKAVDITRRLQDATLGGVHHNAGGVKGKTLEEGRQFTRSISTGSEGYRTSSAGSDSSYDPLSLFIWHDTRHPARAIREMVKLRKEARLTDVVLRTKVKDFPCHRLLLEATSGYLSRVISRDLDGTNIMDVHLKRISADVLEKLIHFMYTGRVAVSDRDATKVYKAAKRFGLEDVCHACITVDPSLETATHVLNTTLADSMLSGATNTGTVEDLLT